MSTEQSKPVSGVLLERLTWTEAERVLRPGSVVVVPLGASAKEHGPHLNLDNDFRLAEYFKRRVLKAADVVVAPTVGFSYYPAFVEYPGSISLRFETARDLMVDVCTSLAAFGPKRFYCLNTGVSTLRPLQRAAEVLSAQGTLLHFTDILNTGRDAVSAVEEQAGGSHADEIETSMMLYIDPSSVDMSKAVRDFHPGEGRLTRTPGAPGAYSPSGVYGDATLATLEKGRRIVEAMTRDILAEIEKLRASALP